MRYKACILAAGIGSRMRDFTKTFNKVLLPIEGKPAICHIIEKFPKNIEIVIAAGYKKETIIDYLSFVYPNRKITFIDVDNYEGHGSGPGYSLLCCKDHLQCPFIQFAGDTLVKEDVPKPWANWVGVAEVDCTERFCSAKIYNERVVKIDDKVKTENKYAFIGLFGVKNFADFWSSLENNRNLISGEIQVSNGLQALINKNLYAKEFTWFDTGTQESYKYSLDNYPNGRSYRG